MDQKPNKAILIFGWLIVIIQLNACLFKIQHWPFSTALLMLAPLLLIFFYLPLWFFGAVKEKSEKVFIIIQFVLFLLYIFYILFKFQKWPGGTMLGNLMFWSTFFILIPVSFIKLFRFGKSSLFKFNNLILFIFLISGMQMYLMRSSETNIGSGSIVLSSIKAETAY